MIKYIIGIFIGIFMLSGQLFGQSITGFVYDEFNNPIPFVKIYVKNFANVGGVSDFEGKYAFGCDYGSYEVIYKCIGFEDLVVTVTVNSLEPTVQNVYLKQANYELNSVEITAKKKNIGWSIVQNVIDHKKDMIQQVDGYTCDIYIKGVETFDKKEKKPSEDPEDDKEPDDLFQAQKDEIQKKLDGENRLNMVEINLTKHFQYPNDLKEIRNGYEKIGNPNQIYFQSTVGGDFNFYESLINKEDLHVSPIVSPLHPSGILTYKYKLVEITATADNDTIYTVEIEPRSVGTTTMQGRLYILKSEWVLVKVDVTLHKGNLKVYDDFHVIQEFEKQDSCWLLKKQFFEYSTKYGKETVKGTTNVVYSNYLLNPDFGEKFFSNEVGITTKEAYERDTTYWDLIRPIPLTPEEQIKKFQHDSLMAVLTSETYLDSVDAVFNQITALKILWFGIEHRNRFKKTQWYISSLANFIEPVQIGGTRAGPGVSYFKKWKNEQWVDISTNTSIGFNNGDFRGNARIYHRYNPKRFGTYSVWFDKGASFINSYDAWGQIFKRENIYENLQGGVWHNIEIFNGFYFSVGLRLESRSPFDLDYKFVEWFDEELENGPPIQFKAYNAFRSNTSFSYTPGQKYVSEPYRKVVLGSRWPTFSFYWEKGIEGVFNSILDYDYLSFEVSQDIQIRTLGMSKYRIKTGMFTNQDSVLYIDRKFFRQSDQDNIFRFLFSQPLYSFQNLDSSYETQDFYLEAHYIHHFNGALFNKLPYMKKTGLQEVLGAGFIYLPEHNNYFYSELFFGVERTFKFARKRLRIGGYMVFSVASNQFALPKEDQPKNVQFKVSFDVMDERDLKFNF